MVSHTIIARFVPGLRLPSYLAFGLFAADWRLFALTVICAVGVWTTLLYKLFFLFGEKAMHMMGDMYWFVIAAIVAVAFIAPRLLSKFFYRKD